MRTALIASSLVISLLIGSAPAQAGMFAKGKLAVACWKHNRSVDPDERLSRTEFAQFKQTGKLPGRVAPAAVLQLKLTRAKLELGQMAMGAIKTVVAANTNKTYDAAVWSENALAALNKGTSRLFEVTAYAKARGLAMPAEVKSLARHAVGQLRWMDDAMKRGRITYDSLYWGRTHSDPYAVASREGNREALTRLASGLK